ncbi:diaminopimelate decarboxylase family protein [Desulforhopalus sp. 52FAK]
MTTIDIPKDSFQERLETCLQDQAPPLSDSSLRAFVEPFFLRRYEFLAPLKEQETPLYLFEPELLRRRSDRFQAAFMAHLAKTGFYYAVKSNNYPEIARILTETGFGLDVSSGIELKMALALDNQDIIFSGPGKTRAELEMAVTGAEKVTVLVDSFHELKMLGELARIWKKEVRIGVRLTTRADGLWRKFGIPPEALSRFINEVSYLSYLHFRGIQFHTSWNLDARAQQDFILSLKNILTQLPATELSQISFIDVGGGYWPEQGEWLQPEGTEAGILRKALQLGIEDKNNHYCQSAISIEDFAEQLGQAIHCHIFPLLPDCRICFEPGRWLCNDVMHLLMTVVDKKSDDLVITDAGTNAVGWERFETDYFPVINLSRPEMTENTCNVLGSLCTPHDVWGYQYWGEDIEIGDVLLIPAQGAYTYSLMQNFIKPLPEVAVVWPAAVSKLP